ncbi:MAG: hypothetical protein IIA11_02670 [Proteobacteria bacterium]|nr:hypothetical protein [Pseudomonadota bacterium]
MTDWTDASQSTFVREGPVGIGTDDGLLRPGEPCRPSSADGRAQEHQRQHPHPFHDCQRIAAEFDDDKDRARDFLLPQHKSLGSERDDPGALSVYERHRIVEHRVADFLLHQVAPYAEKNDEQDVARVLHKISLDMYACRTSGHFGIGTHGKPIIAWDSKCSQARLCPDESRHQAQRLFERYNNTIIDHVRKGGRVYKLWPTLPNYRLGRLLEGKRYIFKRWRNRIVRPQKNKKNKFGHDGSLVIQEDPLSAAHYWNVHLNVIMLTRSRLDFWAVREAWGCNIEMREHQVFTEKGMHNLFNEMVKYSVQPVPAKSIEKKRTKAPAFTEWTPAEALEWFKAGVRFHRVRSYGTLYGVGKPERPQVRPLYWLGVLRWQPTGYGVTWRDHNLADISRHMLRMDCRALDLIRGKRSTVRRGYKQAPRPP